MTIQMTINSIKARIENEVKKELPNWEIVKRLASNAEIAQNQLVNTHLAYNMSGEIVECKNFEL